MFLISRSFLTDIKRRRSGGSRVLTQQRQRRRGARVAESDGSSEDSFEDTCMYTTVNYTTSMISTLLASCRLRRRHKVMPTGPEPTSGT